MLSLFRVHKCVWNDWVGAGTLFEGSQESPIASGVAISYPVWSYLGFSHGLSKAFQNKQVRKFPKTILVIYSDTC